MYAATAGTTHAKLPAAGATPVLDIARAAGSFGWPVAEPLYLLVITRPTRAPVALPASTATVPFTNT